MTGGVSAMVKVHFSDSGGVSSMVKAHFSDSGGVSTMVKVHFSDSGGVSAMVKARFSDPHCRLHLCQKDLRLAVNMSDAVEQPLHVASAVNEVSHSRITLCRKMLMLFCRSQLILYKITKS